MFIDNYAIILIFNLLDKSSNMNFVFVSLQRINTDRDSTATSLAKELAKHHQVLYVNSPIDRKTFLSNGTDEFIAQHKEDIRNKANNLQRTESQLWVLNPAQIIESINWLPSTKLFSILNRYNNRVLANEIKAATQQLGFDQFILINDKDIFRSFYLKEMLKPEKYIYLDRDYTVGMGYWRKHGVALEPKLMKKADAVVCNSHDFTKRAKKYNPNSFYIGNGFDASQYDHTIERAKPEALAAIPGPIIGYVGALITLRLDLLLMVEMAQKRPDWSFVYIGWEDEDFEQSALHQLPNVYMLGKKHTNDVPAYIQHFDVCINPQVLNDITKGNFPLKVVEYLALGKPVVATTTNTMQEVFSQHTYLANDLNEFLLNIEKALGENNDGRQNERLQFARSFSWDKVVQLLLKAIQP